MLHLKALVLATPALLLFVLDAPLLWSAHHALTPQIAAVN
jgi:hypothetical protein